LALFVQLLYLIVSIFQLRFECNEFFI
jgi:hypothetical protein